MELLLTEQHALRMALGGAVLGGGGGGWAGDGIRIAEIALRVGSPRLVDLDGLAPDDVVVTVSAVGAPAAPGRFVRPADYLEALQRLAAQLGRRVAAVMSSENGGTSSLNGWFQSAVTGIPLLDAAGDGRAHPTGVMGSMGLESVDGYVSRQVAVGGNPDAGTRIVVGVEGSIASADRTVRQAAVEAGGLVAVARNPVPASYVRHHGAPGALSEAMRVGEAMLGAYARMGLSAAHVRALVLAHTEGSLFGLPAEEPPGLAREAGNRLPAGAGEQVAEALAEALAGRVLSSGPISDCRLETRGGYDTGTLRVDDVRLTFWNEFMTAENALGRLATFPDLIVALDAHTGLPLATAEVHNGCEVILVFAPRGRLMLADGVRRVENLRVIEDALGVPVLRYQDRTTVS